MNVAFSEATTSVAFLLALSKRQCHALLALADPEYTERDRLWVLQGDSLRPLDRKGLVYWKRDGAGQCSGFGGLTEAGRLVAALLTEAGMTLANTRTASIIDRTERTERRFAERS